MYFFEKKHKADGMMDVVSRKCQMEGCLKRPWYSYDGVKSVFCAEHKAPGMIGYRPPQKDAVQVGEAGGGGGSVGSIDVVGGGGRKRSYANMTIPDSSSSSSHHDHHDQHHQHHNGGSGVVVHSDLVPTGLDDTVGLAEMGMGDDDGLAELDGMGGEVDHHHHHHRHLVGQQIRLDVVGVSELGVVGGGLGGGVGLDDTGIGDGDDDLDPTELSGSADHHHHHHHLGGHHEVLGQRGLETPGLDHHAGGVDDHDGGGQHHHDPHHHHPDDAHMVLQPVLPSHVPLAGPIDGPAADKLFS